MSTLRSGQWTAHEAIYWPNSDKIRHRYRYEGLKSLIYGLEVSPHAPNRKMKLGMRPCHTSNLPVCSGRRKLTTGSRANRLRPQNPVILSVRADCRQTFCQLVDPTERSWSSRYVQMGCGPPRQTLPPVQRINSSSIGATGTSCRVIRFQHPDWPARKRQSSQIS